MRPAFAIVLALGCAAIITGCHEPTQISVEVTTDIDCKDHGGTAIAVGPLGSLGSRPLASLSKQCLASGSSAAIGTAVLVPNDGRDGEVAFEVRTGVGVSAEQCTDPSFASRCIVARRALRFLPGTSLKIRLAMTADCRGVVCNPSSTCVRGACRPADIDPTRCSGAGCGDEVVGNGDGGITDAGDGGITDASDGSVVPPGNVVALGLGRSHSCALMKDQTVRCWGANDQGQVGIGSDAGLVAQPTAVPLAGVRQVAAFAEGNTCALLADGTVRCWGSACCGELGSGDVVPQASPRKVLAVTGAEMLAAGRSHACVVTANGPQLFCWGQWLDTPTAPTQIVGVGGSVRSLGAGDHLTVLGLTDGTVRVFGDNRFGQLGLGLAEDASAGTPTPVPGVTGVVAVANGNSFVHASTADGGVTVWGESSGNQLGVNTTNAVSAPIAAPGLAGLHGAALGDQFGCAIDASNDVVCWGYDQNMSLGAGGDGSRRFTPVKAGVSQATAVFAGWSHACAIDALGSVWCWGANESGQVGDGTTTDRRTPFKLSL